MILNYKIKQVGGEKVLFLYFDYDSEFSLDFKSHHNINNMKQQIIKYIKTKKIKFNGEKIAIVLGGVTLATILLTETPHNDLSKSYVTLNEMPNQIVLVENENTINKETETISTDASINTNTNNNNINNPTNNENTDLTKTDQVKNTNDTVTDKVTKEETIEKNNEETKKTGSTTNEDKKDDITVTIYRSNGNVINLNLEEYLVGVVAAEMPASFPLEALKAQAVVARTYTLKKIEENTKLTDSTSTQSYKDNQELKTMWKENYQTYYKKIKQAVDSTKGISIYYNNKHIDAVYHSTSNGKTEDASVVWKSDIPYLKSVESSWDKSSPSYSKEIEKDLKSLLNTLGISENDDLKLEILSLTNSGRVEKIKVGSKIYSGVEIRNLLGLRSTDFDLEIVGDNVKITTRGYGHGVGLSQYGASGMAKEGYNYKQIINHYYTNVDIKAR